jgi:hypothetical protein
MVPKRFTACTVRDAEPERFLSSGKLIGAVSMGSTRFFTESEFRAELKKLELSEDQIESEVQIARKNAC